MLEKLISFRDRVGAWCAALAMVAGAIFMWNPPAEVTKEISYHRELAMGMGAFGGLLVLVLTLKGGAGYRARALLLLCLAVLVGGGLTWWLQDAGRDIYALKQHGQVRDVEVVGSSMKHNPKTNKTTHLTKVLVDGETRSVELGRVPRRGEWVSVLVAPDRPGAIVNSSVKREWISLIDAKIGTWLAVLLFFVLLFCALSIPVKLWHFLAGPPEGVDPDADRL